MHLDLLAGTEGWASLLSQNPGPSAGKDSHAPPRLSDGICLPSRRRAVSCPVQTVCDCTRGFPGAFRDVCNWHAARTRFSLLRRSISGSALRRRGKAIPCGSEMGFDRADACACSSVLCGSPPDGAAQVGIFSDRLKFPHATLQFTRDFFCVLAPGETYRRANRHLHMAGPGENLFLLFQIQ